MTSTALSWLLFIYTVPAAPTRLRAAVWRDLKRAGAVYLRDGVCILPEHEATRAIFQAIAARVEACGGQVTLVHGARLDPPRAARVVAQLQDERAAEYREVVAAAERLLEHVRREYEHRAFRVEELEALEADLGKVRRWVAQIRARDYFGAAKTADIDALLQRCDHALAAFMDHAANPTTARHPGQRPGHPPAAPPARKGVAP